jgi:CheY-like chemotaxis protein
VDVLICDIGLPDGSGWELMEKVSTYDQAPFGIAMSGYGAVSDREKSLAAGFRHHLVKPFLPEDLDAILLEAANELQKH